jgi:hypothetical protein
MQLFVYIETFGVADLGCHSSDFSQERFELLFSALGIFFQVLDKFIIQFFLNKRFKVFDILVKLRGALFNFLDITMEGLTLGNSTVLHQLAFFYNLCKLCLYSLKLSKVFLLNLGILNFDDG